MIPFYQELSEYDKIQQFLHERMKKKSKRTKELLYSYLKIEYCSVITKHKYVEFSQEILDLLNEHIFMISDYAANNYKGLTRFFMETLLN